MSRVSGRSDLIKIDAVKVHETERAVLLDVGQDSAIWFPKSAVQETDPGEWEMSEALAYEKGVI